MNEQLSKYKRYWYNSGKHQKMLDALNEMIPDEGRVKNSPALERLRIAQNAYHDLYNNGGGNRDADILAIAGFDLDHYRIEGKCNWDGEGDGCDISSVVDYEGSLCLLDCVAGAGAHHEFEEVADPFEDKFDHIILEAWDALELNNTDTSGASQ